MRLILILLAIIVLTGIIRGAFYNLNKVVCHAFDKSYVEFPTCEMKIRSRGVAVFNLNMTLHKKPVHSVVLNLELFKKSNGYRPFLFNQTIDFCYYQRNPMAYTLFQSFHKTFLAASNMNHTCPYNVSMNYKLMQYFSYFIRYTARPHN